MFAEVGPKTLQSFDEGESDSFPGILRLAFTLGLSIGSKFARLVELLLEDALLILLLLTVPKDPLIFINPCSCPTLKLLDEIPGCEGQC